MNAEFVIALTTLPVDHDAKAFACALVEERLAACVHVMPEMQSIYRWQGTIERDSERQIVIKTTQHQVMALWERIRELHPYEVPEFVVCPIIDGSDAYLRWIRESTGGQV